VADTPWMHPIALSDNATNQNTGLGRYIGLPDFGCHLFNHAVKVFNGMFKNRPKNPFFYSIYYPYFCSLKNWGQSQINFRIIQ
jgi:hypothetical protein